MSNSIRLAAGVLEQGTDETLSYRMDFQKIAQDFGEPLSVASCNLYDKELEVNDKLSGEAELSGSIVTSKLVGGLTRNHTYQLNVALNFPGGRVIGGYLMIAARR
jgi:hypothetical protein